MEQQEVMVLVTTTGWHQGELVDGQVEYFGDPITIENAYVEEVTDTDGFPIHWTEVGDNG